MLGFASGLRRVPRIRLALTPTPLEEAPNLSRALGGPRIFIKRDDLTGIAFGGNKLRNLEFRLARTMAERPDTVIVGLDIQSNSARQTIGACNKLGLKTILVLEGRKPDIVQGNLLVDYLLGAEVMFAPTREAQRAALDERAARVRAAGGRPHILNDNPMFDVASALAYLDTTLELLDQMAPIRNRCALYVVQRQGAGRPGARQAPDQCRPRGARCHRHRRVPRAIPHRGDRQRDAGAYSAWTCASPRTRS